MTQTYPLTITRNRGRYAFFRALNLYVKTPSGDVKLGKVRQGKSVTVNIPQDATQIFGKMDWGQTEPYDLALVSPGETLFVNSWFSFNLAKGAGILPLPIKFESTPR